MMMMKQSNAARLILSVSVSRLLPLSVCQVDSICLCYNFLVKEKYMHIPGEHGYSNIRRTRDVEKSRKKKRERERRWIETWEDRR